MKAIKKLFQSETNKNVAKVFSGSAIGQFVAFLAVPVITRLYTQSDLGEYQLFLSTITTFAVLSTFRYEVAVVLPKEDTDGKAVALLSGMIVLIFSILFSIILLTGGDIIFSFLNANTLNQYALFVVVGTSSMGLWQILQFVLIRFKRFGTLSKNRVIQVVVTQAIMILFGYLSPGLIVLFMAQIIGLLLAVVLILIQTWKIWQPVPVKELKNKLREYRKFPLANTPMVFLNTLSQQLPIFMLSKYFSADIIGLFMVANRLVAGPFRMLSKSVSQVYVQTASEAFTDRPGKLLSVYNSTVKKLFFVAILPLIGVLVFAPLFVDLFLEKTWADSAVFMQIIVVVVFFQFIISPVSQTFSIIDRQEIALVLTIFSFIIRVISMYIFRDDAVDMILAYMIAGSLFYIFFHLLTKHYIKRAQ